MSTPAARRTKKAAISIQDSQLGKLIVRVPRGTHRITGSADFGLLGFGYSYATSYSYAGGLNLDRINPVE